MKKMCIAIFVFILVIIYSLPVSAQELDCTKFLDDISEIYQTMDTEERVPVLLRLSYNKGYDFDVPEEDRQDFYKQRKSDNITFLNKYESLTNERILYCSKHLRLVAVKANKAELTAFLSDTEVRSIFKFEQDLGLKNGTTGAQVREAVESYLASKGSVDDLGIVLERFGESKGNTLVFCRILPLLDEIKPIRIGNYIFTAFSCSEYHDLGYFAVVNGELFTVEQAWKQGYINLDEAADIYGGAKKIENLGDFDLNGTTDIQDVTLFQKALAGIVEMPKLVLETEFFIYDVTDFNADGKLNILDATAIQKHIAGMNFMKSDLECCITD